MNHTSNGIETITASDERQQLVRQCHELVTSISRKPYAIKLLRSARDGLLLVAGYKGNRKRK